MSAYQLIILLFIIFSAPIFFCCGFYYGFGVGRSVFTEKTVTSENIPFASLWHTGAKDGYNIYPESPQQRMTRILAENVENYGTSLPQKEVK